MNLLEMLLDNRSSPALQQVAKGFGLSEGDVRNAMSEMVPALSRGMRNNVSKGKGLDALLGALGKGNHRRYLDQPENLDNAAAVKEGNAILGHLLGSKDVSRKVAQHASARTGMDAGLLKKMLPLVATLVMGSVSKQAVAQKSPEGDVAHRAGLLTQFLDADGDGSVLDDVLGIAGKFF